VQQPVDDGPGRSLVHGVAVGVLELAQYLRLAHDHGIQAAGHGEQMLHGLEIDILVGVFHQQVRRSLADARPVIDHGVQGLALGHAFDHGHDLHPVAGGERHAFGERTVGHEPGLEVFHIGEGEFLAHIDPGGPVVQADKDDLSVHGTALKVMV